MASKELQVISGTIRQVYSDEEKRRLVEDSYRSDLGLRLFAKRMGISASSLCQWRKRFKAKTPLSKAKEQDKELCETTATQLVHLDNVVGQVDSLKLENKMLKDQLYKLKAFIGHKIFEFESSGYANP